MNKQGFLELSKRNIFHAIFKCKNESDPKYIPNYAPYVIVEFDDSDFTIKDINTKKVLFSCGYEDIISVHLSVCSRVMSIRKMFDIEYIITTKEHQFHIEGKNAIILTSILSVLRNYKIDITDPLLLEENIKNCKEIGDFYNFCEKNLEKWKKEFNIPDPRVGDLI